MPWPPRPLAAKPPRKLSPFPRVPFWRIVNSGSGRSVLIPSGRGSVARISGRWTGPSSSGALRCARLPARRRRAPAAPARARERVRSADRVRDSGSTLRRGWRNGGHGDGAAHGAVRLSAARRLASFVGMFGVARRASSLLDLVLDHRDDHVIRHAALARTVVVQYVTETQPALLHLLPRIVT